MSVHLGHKNNAHIICLTLLTDSIHHMLKLHRMMDRQFLQYRTVLGVACDDGNWILSSQFDETVFVDTYRAWLIGADAFSETGHTRCVMYLWAALKTHRVLQGYIEMDVIAHSEVSCLVVEHLTPTMVKLAMHNAVKAEFKDLTTNVKTVTAKVDTLDSKLSQQVTDIAKVQQDMKMTLKK
jgi:hypothetical protein